MSGQSTTADFGQLLRETRRRNKMSQVELGGDRYSGSYISHLESGRRLPTPDVVEFLARRLGVSALDWGTRAHYDKGATLRTEQQAAPDAIESLLVAERAWYDRDWSSAESHAQRAAEGAKAAGDETRHWEAMYVVAQARFASAEFAQAAQIAQELTEHPTAQRYPVARAQSLSLASTAYRASSRLGWAIAFGARAVEAASASPAIIRAEALMALVSALSEAGHGGEEAAPYLQRLADLAPELSANHSRGMVAWTLGTAAYKSGDAVEGGSRYAEARGLLSPQRDLRLWLRFHRSEATCRLDVGISEGVAELLRISSTGLEIIGNPVDVVELRQARARLALLENDPATAADLVQGVLADPALNRTDFNRGQLEWILASALQRLGDEQAAIQHFCGAGVLFEQDGRLKQALDAYRTVLDLAGQDYLTHRLDTDGQTMV